MIFGLLWIFHRYPFKLKSLLVIGPGYFLKHQRENLAAIFVAGDYDRANWHLTLSKKRMTEAETLFRYSDLANSLKFTLKSRQEGLVALRYCQQAEARGEDIEYIKSEINQVSKRQEELIRSLGQ